MNDMNLTARRGLVIGADVEAGRMAALTLAGTGMKLALAGADAAKLMRTAALTGRPLDMLVLPADLTKARDADSILHILEGHFKGLDVLASASDDPAALALCRRALALMRASDDPVLYATDAIKKALAQDFEGVRFEDLDGVAGR